MTIVVGVFVVHFTNSVVKASQFNNKTPSPPLLSSVKSRLLERRRLTATNNKMNSNHRKLIEGNTDPSSVVDGQYIIIFDPDHVGNVTEKVTQLFNTTTTKSQILYIYDNIAIKGVAIRNVTIERLYELESDPDILSIEPVRKTSIARIFAVRYD